MRGPSYIGFHDLIFDFLSQSGNGYHYYAFKCDNENVVQKKIFIEMKISLTSTILQNKVTPVFWLCQKSIEA